MNFKYTTSLTVFILKKTALLEKYEKVKFPVVADL